MRLTQTEINRRVEQEIENLKGFLETVDPKAIFNQVIESAETPEQVAKLELAREYFTNEAFREWLQETTFAASQERAINMAATYRGAA